MVFIFQEGEWPERDQLLLHVCLFKSSFSFLDDDDENLFVLSFLDDEDEDKNLFILSLLDDQDEDENVVP